ncbi:sulfatase [Ochrovirga pacifica]|uniref:sulfatase n=1 Tax=Ochrovirga pacifica TaxID=1042376 RepID=UPI000255955D|nr:sulfatase [Ochrovirga pacifica]
MKNLILSALFFTSCLLVNAQKKPNVLFIAIDDLNDWIEPLGGNKQAITPNMDKFTKKGAMVFNNAVCAAPICGPSRSAILSGFLPSTSGVYGNAHDMVYSDVVKKNATLPEYFSKNGYYTLSNGKIFHKHGTKNGLTDFGAWAYDEFARGRRYNNDKARSKFLTSSKAGIINGQKSPDFKDKRSKLSWGATQDTFEETVDYAVADWATKQLQRDFGQPFFMSVGFIKPHLPWFVPKEFFDMYDVNEIEDIIIKEDDLEDITNAQGKQIFKPSDEYNWIKKHNLGKQATRAYLANITFVDKCLGMVMDALEKSGHADNTIVMIWGDHGWHLGEKLRYLKNTLWAEAVKPPLMVRLPGMKKTIYCEKPVSLLDMYPTLVSLCDLPKKKNIEGHDFSALLKNPKAKWEYPGVTVSTSGTSVLTEDFHYIQYTSGAIELYDVKKDPREWDNLAKDESYEKIISELNKWVPKERTKAKKEHYKKAKNYVDADQDPTIKQHRKLSELE